MGSEWLEESNTDRFTKILVLHLFQEKMKERNLGEKLLLSQAVRDFQDYMLVKYGKHWRRVFHRMFEQHPLTLSSQLDDWIWLWLQKWRQRVRIVVKKPKRPHRKFKQVSLSDSEKQALIEYTKEVLVRRGEIAGISQIAQATVATAQRRLGKRGRDMISRASLMFKLTHEIHRTLQSLLHPTSKVLLVALDAAMEKTKQKA